MTHSPVRRPLPAGALLLLLAAPAGPAIAAYSCNVSVTGVGVLYTTSPVNQDANGTVTLTCSRDTGDANTLSYRIKADDGLNASGTQRRVRLGATNKRLNYSLRRGTTVGGSASCGNSSNWAAPNGGNKTIRGTLAFGTSLTASDTWGYCARVRGNQGNPTGGSYTDVVQVFAQYPDSNAGALTSSVALDYRVGVGNQCVFSTPPSAMQFDYTSFADSPQISMQTLDVRCNDSLPWSVTLSPPGGTLMGLNYTLDLTPDEGTGTGLDQPVLLTGTVPAGQSGTCATATCSASQSHAITITY